MTVTESQNNTRRDMTKYTETGILTGTRIMKHLEMMNFNRLRYEYRHNEAVS